MNGYQRHFRATAAYQTAAETQTPAQQIVMLYDGAIRRLKEARIAIQEGRIEERYHLVMKAYAIVNALQSCLDFDQGGEVAPLLDRFYGYLLGRMMQINIKNDASICDEVVERLMLMRASWAQIADGTAPGMLAASAARQAVPAALTT